MKLIITPSKLRGEITPPPSKSELQRAIICAALARGRSVVRGYRPSDDVTAVVRCANALKLAELQLEGDALTITGGARKQFVSPPVLDCGASGAAYRFFMPIALATAEAAEFEGDERLFLRPIAPLTEALAAHGAGFLGKLVYGGLKAGNYMVNGAVSSQFASALLLALPLLRERSRLIITPPIGSRGYIELTLAVRRAFGVEDERDGDVFRIVPQDYEPCDYTVSGDWSYASVFLAMNVLGGRIKLKGMAKDTFQPDETAPRVFSALVRRGDLRLSAALIPDMVPAIATVAALRDGAATVITDAARLRGKESDRLTALAEGLGALGARIRETPDGLIIRGVGRLKGGAASAANDHRIAMALAVASTVCTAPVAIDGAEAVNKSAPDFWRDFQSLGGSFREQE